MDLNIIHIIGNGFDINLGLNTKYSDFYKYFYSKETQIESVNSLKNRIKKTNFKIWADLEYALGKDTENINDINEFDEIIEAIKDSLAEHLDNEESRFNIENFNQELFIERLFYPELGLRQNEINKIDDFKSKNFSSVNWKVNIFTFNYTTALEKLVQGKLSINTKNHKFSRATIINSIQHIHGYTDRYMVLGVNDTNQITNEKFRDDNEIINSLVKVNCNSVLGHTIDNELEQRIKEAEIICIYGSSIGPTDKVWWERIIDHLLNSEAYLIIYNVSDKPVQLRHVERLERYRTKTKNNLLSYVELKDEDKQRIRERIFVGVNSDYFEIKKVMPTKPKKT